MPTARTRGKRWITADECRSRITVAFGLEYLVTFNRAELTDGTVNRTQIIGFSEWTRVVSQCACKKIIEALIARNIGVRGFRHVDIVAIDKPANQAPCYVARVGTGNLSGKGS